MSWENLLVSHKHQPGNLNRSKYCIIPVLFPNNRLESRLQHKKLCCITETKLSNRINYINRNLSMPEEDQIVLP